MANEHEMHRLYPVVGYELATLPDGGVFLKLTYLSGLPPDESTADMSFALSGQDSRNIGRHMTAKAGETRERAKE